MSREEAVLYVRLRAYQRLLERTNTFIADSLSKVKAPYVACSFGKDSAVMLDLVRQHQPDIAVVFLCYPETNFIDNYDEVIAQWGVNIHSLLIDSDILDEINEKDVIPKWALHHGYDAGFVGLRMQESVGRRITLKKLGPFYHSESGITRICPLMNWSWRDVAAYTLSNNLPILSTYLKEGFEERTTTGLADDAYGFRQSQLNRLKRNDLSRFNLLLKLYPELSVYA